MVLTLGQISVTELDAFSGGDFRQSFENVGLVKDCKNVSEFDINMIVRKYADQQALHMAISGRRLMWLLFTAKATLKELFGQANVVSSPRILDSSLKEAAMEGLTKIETEKRKTFVTTVYEKLSKEMSLPPVEDFLNATTDNPMTWTPALSRRLHQNEGSFDEQSTVLQFTIAQIEKYIRPDIVSANNVAINGPAGSGKTFVMLIALLYAISRGLKVILLSYSSERARSLGATHIHLEFPLEVCNNQRRHPKLVAKSCIDRLRRNPLQTQLLRRCDIFAFEEVGFISSALYDVLDCIVRQIEDSELHFAGKLVIASGDHNQIPPIEGVPFWDTYHLITSFKVLQLKEPVRTAADPDLTRCLAVFHKDATSDEINDAVETIISKSSHVEDWKSVPLDRIRIVGTRQAAKEVVEEYLQAMRTQASTTNYLKFKAVDEVEGCLDNWYEADRFVKRKLNIACLEPETVEIFEKSVMRFTYNERHSPPEKQFSQGGLCIIEKVHPEENVVEVSLVPPGLRNFTSSQSSGWQRIQIRPRTTLPVFVGNRNTKARRLQFPLAYHVASTAHKIQGENCNHIATQVSDIEAKYRLWQKEQLYTILSRVEQFTSITFVGNRDTTSRALKMLMSQKSQWSQYISDKLRTLNIMTQPESRILTFEYHPFRPFYRELPDTMTGFVYLLLSTRSLNHTYIGQTKNLLQRLHQHNSGAGTEYTNDVNLQPWAVLAYVHGFEDFSSSGETVPPRVSFESDWNRGLNLNSTPNEVLNKGLNIVNEMNRNLTPDKQLIFVICGEVRRT